MSYSAIEAEIQSLVQALDEFSDEDVTRGDYRVLDRGSPPYVVLLPGAFDRENWASPGGIKTDWIVAIDLFVRHWGDGTEQTNLETYRQAVIDQLDIYPRLEGLSGVQWCLLEGGEDPRPVYDEAGGGPHFLLQRMILRVTERVTVTGGDYG